VDEVIREADQTPAEDGPHHGTEYATRSQWLVEGGGPAVERMKKKIVKLFKAQDLKITTKGILR
jgi:hypothetical protein